MTHLEDKLLYRLVKVSYIVAFLLTSLIAILIGWGSRPIPVIDDNKSTITCSNGNSYSLNTVNIYATLSETQKLDSYDDRQAREFCKKVITYTIKNKLTGEMQTIKYSDFAKYNVIEPELNTISYTFNLVEGTRGSWGSAFAWWILGIAGSYIVLNLIRETLNYILFGKSFDWMWLIIPIAFIASSSEEKS